MCGGVRRRDDVEGTPQKMDITNVEPGFQEKASDKKSSRNRPTASRRALRSRNAERRAADLRFGATVRPLDGGAESPIKRTGLQKVVAVTRCISVGMGTRALESVLG